jgi:hypothetical protein
MGRQRASLGRDPLDALLGSSTKRGIDFETPMAQRREAKVRATFHLPRSLVNEARDATVALSGPPLRLTLARLVEDGIKAEIARLRTAHNNGEPFPERDADLVGGRPIGSRTTPAESQ